MFGPRQILEGKGLAEGQSWPSEAHQRVAACAFGFNESINDLPELQRCVSVLLGYTEEQIKLVTVESLRDAGLPV